MSQAAHVRELRRDDTDQLENPRVSVEKVEVCLERALDALFLDLDDNVLAAQQLCRVHLRNGCRGERSFLNGQVDSANRLAQLGLDQWLDVTPWHGRRRVEAPESGA